MTKLDKRVKREVDNKRLKLIVAIEPECEDSLARIVLWEKGCRRKYSIAIVTLYALLVKGEK